jgi:predicted transcriptional regulator
MAAMFAGASRALLASVVFAFETTRQPMGLLPLLGGCTASFLLSCLLMRNTIMTEKIVRRGVRVPGEYAADFLDQVTAGLAASKPVVTLKADDPLDEVRAWMFTHAPGSTHQGFPVVDAKGELLGLVTRRDLLGDVTGRLRDLVKRAPALVYEDSSLREAADHMVQEGVGRLPVVSRAAPRGAHRHHHAQRSARRAPAPPRGDAPRRAEHRLAESDEVKRATCLPDRFRPGPLSGSACR